MVVTDTLNKYVIVEGVNMADIMNRARALGIYFDGCRQGRDCNCCGDRWRSPWEGQDGELVPTIYGEPVEIVEAPRRPNVAIHYMDGTVKFATG